MITDWPAKIFDYEVERKEIPRKNNKPYYATAHTQIGVLHTTEGSTVSDAWAALSSKHEPSHFIVGEGRIVQCRPLTKQASSLHGDPPFYANANAALQIEMVGFTGGNPNFNKHAYDSWIPADDVLKPVIAIMAWASANGLDIPLQVPSAAWVDDGSDCPRPWAVENKRRLQAAHGLWPSAKGWWTHMEVPGQGPTWHYDCGAIRRTQIIQMARDLLGAGTGVAVAAAGAVAGAAAASTPIAAPQPSPVIIRLKDVGANVKLLQQQLIRLGLLSQGSDDGAFGQHTLDAVKKFQTNQGLNVDGIVGPATRNKLIDAIHKLETGGNQ